MAENASALDGGINYKRYQSQKKNKCEWCKQERDARGFFKHVEACQKAYEKRERMAAKRLQNDDNDEVLPRPKRGRHFRQPDPAPTPPLSPSPQPAADPEPPAPSLIEDVTAEQDHTIDHVTHAEDDNFAQEENTSEEHSTLAVMTAPDPTTQSAPPNPSRQAPPAVDSIKVQYHKATRRRPEIYAFEDFTRDQPNINTSPVNKEPWKPAFNSRLDFELAELAHEAHMNKGQVQRLLNIIHNVAAGKDKFTFVRVDDVDHAWSKAQRLYPSFEVNKYPVEYKNEIYDFEFHHRPLWPWFMSQVQDQRSLSKYDGNEWVRFFDEPWTADSFAKAQTRITKICPDGKPFAIILWADKSKLSTFGTQKGHFIIARCGNLPEYIRNGAGLGSGRIVGFVPLIENEDPKEKKKKKYVNFKNAVYHKAFLEFLKEVALYSRTGYQVKCGDCVYRTLFPYIHILSADYQEQCYMCLIRGLGGNAPCPVCLVPKGTLSDIKTKYPDRTATEMKELVAKVELVGQKEKTLGQYGLRNVENAFWSVENTDVHVASSFDRLHAYDGLFQHHLFPELKTVVTSLGRSAATNIEDSVSSMPRWSELSHFKGILDLDFSDGQKWDDITKFVVNVTYHELTQQKTPKGFALLRLIRKFVELNRFLSMEVQTTKTMEAFTKTLDGFHDRLQDYKEECRDDDKCKDWDGVIKIHSHVHAVRDIRMKGALCNMDTKPNERLNGPMRKAYQMQTNFKHIESQLGKIEDRSMASCTIRSHIDALDAMRAPPEDTEESVWQFNNVYLGSRSKKECLTTVSGFVSAADGDRAFQAFRYRLSQCVNGIREREEPGTFIRVQDTDRIIDCHFLKVDYESRVSWRQITDRLRCTADWGGQARYDTVLVDDGESGLIFCRLLRLFTYTSEEDKRPFALVLVQPLNAPVEHRSGDYELGLCRVREKDRSQTRVLPARAVIRGALIVSDPAHPKEYTVVDTVDNDMFLRCMDLFPERDTIVIK